MDFELTSEQSQLQALARRFVEKSLRPREAVLEDLDDIDDSLHAQLVAEAKEATLWACFGPESVGGGDIRDFVTRTAVQEPLGTTSYALRYYVDNGAVRYLDSASSYQNETFFRPQVEGKVRAFTAATEPDAGSDNGAMTTRAERDGDEWIINGTKHFISGAEHASFGVVYAVTDPERGKHGGISGFIVPKGTPGFTVGRQQRMMGHRGFPQFVLHFDDCRIPNRNMIGQDGEGLKQFLRNVTAIRIKIGIEAVGAAQYALDLGIEYAKSRVVLGSTLAEKQGIQWMIVDSAMELRAARLMCYLAASRADAGADVRTDAAMAKAFGTEVASRVIDKSLQIHGGMGYSEELPLARLYRDIRGTRIYEGPTELQRYIIAREILG